VVSGPQEPVHEPQEHVLPDETINGLSAVVLDSLSADTTLVGTPRMLARSLGVSADVFRSSLRELLQSEQIVVQAGARGQLTIRRAPLVPAQLPALAPPSPRRRNAMPRAWSM
jgi:hypothetical protein